MVDTRTDHTSPEHATHRPGLDPGLALSLLLALLAAWPLLAFAGLPNTADGPAHLMRQAELNLAWQDGILFPRWAPDLAYGYGMPLFSYAPPLLYQVTQLLHLPGLALDESMKGTLILMLLLYGAGMYLFARDLFGPRAGLLAAAAYLYAPYRLREVYIQGNYGQFCGLAFYPLILWAFYRVVVDGRMRYVLVAALSVAGLLFSHNISFMLFAPLLLAFLAYLAAVGGVMRLVSALRCALAAGLGLALAAVFWLPAFVERDFIRLAGITSGFFDFRNNFIRLDELLALPQRLDLAAINPRFPLGLGSAHLCLAGTWLLVGVAWVVWSTTRPGRTGHRSPAWRRPHAAIPPRARGTAAGVSVFFALALLVYAFLALPESSAVWEGMPLLDLAEFPWRMLGVAILCAAVLAGALVQQLEEMAARAQRADFAGRATLAIGLVVITAAALPYLFPIQFIPWGTPNVADVMAYEAQSRAIGTTSTGEFLPRWADRYPSPDVLMAPTGDEPIASRLDPASLPAGAETATLRHTAGETVLSVDSPRAFEATFRVLYWPGWTVWVSTAAVDDVIDGRDLAKSMQDYRWRPVAGLTISRPDGLIEAPLPAGRYLVRLQLEDTPVRKVGWVISGLSVVACVVAVAVRLRWATARVTVTGMDERRYPRREALVVAGAIVLGLLVTRPLDDWMLVQSPVGSVHGVQHPLSVTFAGKVRLLGYDIPDCARWTAPVRCSAGPSDGGLPEVQVPAGGSLTTVLYWQAVQPLVENYSVFLHLDAPDGSTVAGADEINPEDIPSSAWPPTLHLRNPLTLSVPPAALPIRYTLTAGLYDRTTGARLAATECGSPARFSRGGGCEALPLAHVWPTAGQPVTESQIPHRLDYRLGDSIQLLGYVVRPGEPAIVTLYWRADRRQTTAYTVFVHARDKEGNIVTQVDGPPFAGLYPTDAWLPGQIVADARSLAWSPLIETLVVGLYDPANMLRLAVTDNRGQAVPEDTVVIQVTHGQD